MHSTPSRFKADIAFVTICLVTCMLCGRPQRDREKKKRNDRDGDARCPRNGRISLDGTCLIDGVHVSERDLQYQNKRSPRGNSVV